MGERLIYVERPDVLPEEKQLRLGAWRRDRLLTDGSVPWVTVGSAFDELEKLKVLDAGGDASLLTEIEQLLNRERVNLFG